MDREITASPIRRTTSRRQFLGYSAALIGAGGLFLAGVGEAEAQSTPVAKPAAPKPVAPGANCGMGPGIENGTTYPVAARFTVGGDQFATRGFQETVVAQPGETKLGIPVVGFGDRRSGAGYGIRIERLDPNDLTKVVSTTEGEQACGQGYKMIVNSRPAVSASPEAVPTVAATVAPTAGPRVEPTPRAPRPTMDPNEPIIPSFGDFVRGVGEVSRGTGDSLKSSPDARNAATWIIPVGVVALAVWARRRFWG